MTPPDATTVTVRAEKAPGAVTGTTLSREDAAGIAGTTGDPLKAVQALPGVTRPSFGLGPLIVWGASPRDTRVYVDDVEVPALYHGGGIRSTIGAGMVGSLELVPGAYGPDYGRGLGGIVRVRTAALRESGVHGTVTADPLDASAMVTGAVDDRVRAGASVRVSYLDRVLTALGEKSTTDRVVSIPRYDDAQGKLSFRLRPREQLSVAFLHSSDHASVDAPSLDPGGTRRGASSLSFQRFYLSYVYLESERSRVTVTPFYGMDESTNETVFGGVPTHLDVSAVRYGVRAARETRWSDRVAFTVGADVGGTRSHLYREGSLTLPAREGDITVFGQPPGEDVNADRWTTHVVGVAPYARARLALGPVVVVPGVRYDGYLIQGNRTSPQNGQTPPLGYARLEGAFEPRLEVRWQATARLGLSAATGVLHAPPAPEDLSAVFGTPGLTLSSAKHLALGQSLSFGDTTHLDVTEFLEVSSALPVRSLRTTPASARALVQDGEGRSYGVQVILKQEAWEGFSGWIAYTLSRSERRYRTTPEYRLFDYDRTHVLSVVARQELEKWTFGARLSVATGLPRTQVTGSYYDLRDDRYEPIFGAQNATRLPAYFQLDVRAGRTFALSEATALEVYVEGMNLTFHDNAEEILYSRSYSRHGYITGLPPLALAGGKLTF